MQLQVLLLNITLIYSVYVITFKIDHSFSKKKRIFSQSPVFALNDQNNSSTELYK